MDTVICEEVVPAPKAYAITRSSMDEGRKLNILGKRLLDLCGENGLVIGMGGLGKIRVRGTLRVLRMRKGVLLIRY